MILGVRWVVEAVAVSRFSFLSLRDRLGSHLASAIGVAGVVVVFVGILSVGEGFRSTQLAAASPNTVLILQSGSDTELMSTITRDEADTVAAAPGVLRTAEGPLVSAEVVVLADIPLRSRSERANVVLRGVEPAGFSIRSRFRLSDGRRFDRGTDQLIAGKAAEREFRGANTGSKIVISDVSYPVVGTFGVAGSVAESEIWADAPVVQSIYSRSHYQSLRVRLESKDSFAAFADAIQGDPRLRLRAIRESDYYAEQSRVLDNVVSGLGGLVSALMALGAVFGAVNALHGSVAARTREIALLRALGFRRGPVLVSVLAESLAVAAVSGIVGAALAYVAFEGRAAATLNWSGFNEIGFTFRVSPDLLRRAVLYSVGLGFVGGLLPALRAARLPVARVIREP